MTKITRITARSSGQFCFIADNQLYLYSFSDRSTTHLLDPQAMGDSAIIDLKISGDRISVLTDGHVYELTKTARRRWKSKSNFIYYPLEDESLRFTELALLDEETYLKTDTGSIYKISSAGNLEPCTEVSNNKAISSSDIGVVILLENSPVNKMNQSIELPVSAETMTFSIELDEGEDLGSSSDSVSQSTMEGSLESILLVKDHPSLYLIGPIASLYNSEKTTVSEIKMPLDVDFTPISVQVYGSMIIVQDDCGDYHYRLPQMKQFDPLECNKFIGLKNGIMYCAGNNKYVYLYSKTNELEELPEEAMPDVFKHYLQNQHQEDVLQEAQILVENIQVSERLAKEIERSHAEKVDDKWTRILYKRLPPILNEFLRDFSGLATSKGCGKKELKKELDAEFRRIFHESGFNNLQKLEAVRVFFNKQCEDVLSLLVRVSVDKKRNERLTEYAKKLASLFLNIKTKIDAFSTEHACEREYTAALSLQELDKFMHFYQVVIEQGLKEAMQAKGFTPELGQTYLIQLEEFLAQQQAHSSTRRGNPSIMQQMRFTLWTSVKGVKNTQVLEATAQLALRVIA